MKKTYAKPEDFKIDPAKPVGAKCTCIDCMEIVPACLENGICPTLKIISVQPGFKISGKIIFGKNLSGLGKKRILLGKFFDQLQKST